MAGKLEGCKLSFANLNMSAAVTETEGKKRFARLLLQHPGDARRCAEILCAEVGISDGNVAIQIMRAWPNDPVVIEEQERLLATEGEETFLPSKSDLARLVWGIADSQTAAAEDRLKAAKQYAELMGYVVKTPQVAIQVNKVMQVKDFGEDDEWERKALEQQNKLLQHASTIN